MPCQYDWEDRGGWDDRLGSAAALVGRREDADRSGDLCSGGTGSRRTRCSPGSFSRGRAVGCRVRRRSGTRLRIPGIAALSARTQRLQSLGSRRSPAATRSIFQLPPHRDEFFQSKSSLFGFAQSVRSGPERHTATHRCVTPTANTQCQPPSTYFRVRRPKIALAKRCILTRFTSSAILQRQVRRVSVPVAAFDGQLAPRHQS
jgi:hypothetical protein